MCQGETKLFVEGFAFIIKQAVYGVIARGVFMGVLTSRVGEEESRVASSRTVESISYLTVAVANDLKWEIGGSNSLRWVV